MAPPADLEYSWASDLVQFCEENQIDISWVGSLKFLNCDGDPIILEQSHAKESFDSMIENMILEIKGVDRSVAQDARWAFGDLLDHFLSTGAMPESFMCRDSIWNAISVEARELFKKQVIFANVLFKKFADLHGEPMGTDGFSSVEFCLQSIRNRNQHRMSIVAAARIV